jgi:YggT family protein
VESILTIVRYSVFAVVALASVAAFGSWLVRTRRLSPFSTTGRFLKRASDWAVAPVERQVVRRGGNPVHAGVWLVVVVAVVGLILIAVVQWAAAVMQQAYHAFSGGFRPTYHFLVGLVYAVLTIALFLRVIASWFGVFRYAAFMRPVYWLTDWIVKLVQRFLPPIGPLDVSPIVAWLMLWVGKVLLLALVP